LGCRVTPNPKPSKPKIQNLNPKPQTPNPGPCSRAQQQDKRQAAQAPVARPPPIQPPPIHAPIHGLGCTVTLNPDPYTLNPNPALQGTTTARQEAGKTSTSRPDLAPSFWHLSIMSLRSVRLEPCRIVHGHNLTTGADPQAGHSSKQTRGRQNNHQLPALHQSPGLQSTPITRCIGQWTENRVLLCRQNNHHYCVGRTTASRPPSSDACPSPGAYRGTSLITNSPPP